MQEDTITELPSGAETGSRMNNDKRPMFYTLDGHTPVPGDDAVTWGRWLESHTAERIVQYTEIGAQSVSTVFLGVDHNFGFGGPPLLFETMVFPECMECWRYGTWEEALAGHAAVVAEKENGV